METVEKEIETIEETETEIIEDTEDAQETETEEEAENEEVTVTIGEESPPQEEEQEEAPSWVKELREQQRQLKKENKELKKKLEVKSESVETMPTAPKQKPTLEECDYDEDVYAEKLDQHYQDKQEYEKHQEKINAQQQEQSQSWESTLQSYAEKRNSLKVSDYEDAEEIVTETLNETQQGMILQGADNPATLVYALGKNPQKAKELAGIQDPVKFAFAVAKLEAQLKVTPKRKPTTKVEKTIKGSGSLAGTMDKKLDRLREEANKTGDFSKVHAYKKQLRNKE